MTRLVAALLASTLFASVPARSQAVDPARPAEPSHAYTTVPGDTVIGISRRLLVDPTAWREVARFNALPNPNRIAIGVPLRIPLRLLQSEDLSATVERVGGDSRSGAAALTAGSALPVGSALATGADGSALIRLADGSVLRLAARSRMVIDRARRFPAIDQVESGVRLDEGRVEVRANKVQAGKPGFQVRTPQGVLGVRGTEFRVSVQADAQLTTGEVLEGVVQAVGGTAVEPVGDAAGRRLDAGFGTTIDGARQVAEPTPLLPAPDLRDLPALQERLVVRFPVPAVPGATGFRGQIARDATMQVVLADERTPGPELRFPDLDDGEYVLRLRAVDARGIEGRDALLPFRLKARPEPPVPTAPPPRGVTRGTRVSLAWTANPDAATYHLQVARDAAFAQPVRDEPAVAAIGFELDGLTPGDYVWRLASVRAGNDRGPWGPARAFVVRPPPPTPPAPSIGDKTLTFSWEGEPGQTFQFQLASDPRFQQLVLERSLDQPSFELPRPDAGVYYMRLRARDADGFQGPYTTPQRFEIIDCARTADGACLTTLTGEPLRQQR